MKNILITGGSRGIGVEFTRQYLDQGYRVMAASRNPEGSLELLSLKERFGGQLTVHPLDVSDGGSRQRLFKDLSGQLEKIDILINNAGIASGNGKIRYLFGGLNQEDLCQCILVNSVSQLMMTEMFFPLLKKAESPIVVNMSSNSGSIARKKGNGSTGYGYSASKAALNMFTRMLSLELKEEGIIVVSFHPGWVRTTMLYCENAPLEPAESIHGMIQVIQSLSLEDSGKFIDWQGNELPW